MTSIKTVGVIAGLFVVATGLAVFLRFRQPTIPTEVSDIVGSVRVQASTPNSILGTCDLNIYGKDMSRQFHSLEQRGWRVRHVDYGWKPDTWGWELTKGGTTIDVGPMSDSRHSRFEMTLD